MRHLRRTAGKTECNGMKSDNITMITQQEPTEKKEAIELVWLRGKNETRWYHEKSRKTKKKPRGKSREQEYEKQYEKRKDN